VTSANDHKDEGDSPRSGKIMKTIFKRRTTQKLVKF